MGQEGDSTKDQALATAQLAFLPDTEHSLPRPPKPNLHQDTHQEVGLAHKELPLLKPPTPRAGRCYAGHWVLLPLTKLGQSDSPTQQRHTGTRDAEARSNGRMVVPEGGTLSSRAGSVHPRHGSSGSSSIQLSEPLQVPSNAFLSSPLNLPDLFLLLAFNGNLTTNLKFKQGLGPPKLNQ